MFTIKKFLCCLELGLLLKLKFDTIIIRLIWIVLILESGGTFVGCLGIICHVLVLTIGTLASLYCSNLIIDIYNDPTMWKVESSKPYMIILDEGKEFFIEGQLGIGTVKFLTLMVLFYSVTFLRMWASLSLLNGTRSVSSFIFQAKFVI